MRRKLCIPTKKILSVMMFIIVLFVSAAAFLSFNAAVVKADSFEESLGQFPESYRPYLRDLHSMYPAFVFIPDYIDMDFMAAAEAETGRKKTYYDDYPSWKACFDYNYNWNTGEWYSSEGEWTYTTREVICYYLDSRNFLTPERVFEFLCQSYSEDQTEEGLRQMLKGSFMEGKYTPDPNDPDDVAFGGDYARVIMEAARVSGVSPYVLAASIMLEQGIAEESVMVYGRYPGYEGLYNFYNVAATGLTDSDIIVNGLTYARNHGWTSRYKALVLGAEWYANGYINNGQDTYFYMDFNLKNGDLSHQYATSLFDAAIKGKLLSQAYEPFTNAPLVFKIPIFNNMPASPAAWPAENYNLNNYYFLNLGVPGLSPEFDIYTNYYDLSIAGDTVIEYTVPNGASYIGPASFAVSQGDSSISLTVKSETGYTRDYVIYVHAQNACTVYIGNGPVQQEPGSGEVTEPEVPVPQHQKDESEIVPQMPEIKLPEYTLGDVNGDGVIDIIDLAKVQKHILNKTILTGNAFLAADVNASGNIDIIDLAKIQKYLLGRISSF